MTTLWQGLPDKQMFMKDIRMISLFEDGPWYNA